MNELELLKLGIKKLLDRSTPVQLLEFNVDNESDRKAIQTAHDKWETEDNEDKNRTTQKYVFRDEYSFNHHGDDFKIYLNGQQELIPVVDDIHEQEPEIKVVEIEIGGQDLKTVHERDMDDELKKLIKQYAFSRNILIMENNKSNQSSEQETLNDFPQFIQDTINETLKFIDENKSEEFISTYLEEKLNTAHLFGYNEAKHNK